MTAASDRVTFREATGDELESWDDLTVHVGGGHVYQSRAWAAHRAARGWQPHFLVGSDGSAVLSLSRPWPLVGGSGVYLPRGPVPAGGPDAMLARLLGAGDWLAAHGADVIASDAEIPAATGYPGLVRGAGYRAIPEIQPSRHRLLVSLAGGVGEDAVYGGVSKSTRQRIAAAERDGLEVIRHDRIDIATGDLFVSPAGPSEDALGAFARLLLATGRRVGFRIGDVQGFLDWWIAALAAGHVVFLEILDAGAQVGGLLLYRHGGRLSTVHSADDPASRRRHPGLMHLLRWRAIQLAIREGCAEMDLGGVDVGPDHAEPGADSPTHGLYEHKRSFGAQWVEMSGAHELVLRPWRYGLGRVTSRLARLAGR